MQTQTSDNPIPTDHHLDQALDMLDRVSELSDQELESLAREPESMEAIREATRCAEGARARFAPKSDVLAEWERFAATHEAFDQPDHSEPEDEAEDDSGSRRRTLIISMRILLSVASVLLLVVFVMKPWKKTQPYLYAADTNRQQVELSSSAGKQTIDKQEIICQAGRNSKSTSRITVPEGRTIKVTLTDGTEVWLNSGSTLSYPEVFDARQRSVSLRGEAYFKVRHIETQPFMVKVNGLVVTDVGTEFNIRGYAKHDTHVTLVEGRVDINAQGRNIKLKPGEDAASTGTRISVSTVDTDDFTSWREGIIVFNDATLQQIAVNICKWYQLNLICKQSALLDKRLHYVFDRNADVQEALAMLKEISGTNISVTDNTLLIDEPIH